MRFRNRIFRFVAIFLVCVLIVNTTGCESHTTQEETDHESDVEQSALEPTMPLKITKPSQITKPSTIPVSPIPDYIESVISGETDLSRLDEWLTWKNDGEKSTQSTSSPIPTMEITSSPEEQTPGDTYINSKVIYVENQPYTYCGKTGLYTGDWRGDRPEGNGRFTVSEDEYYEGLWDCGYIYGEATILRPGEDGRLFLYGGQCTIDTVTGMGYVKYIIGEEDAGVCAIFGDFSNESELMYWTFDNEDFLDDIGYVSEGKLISYLDDLESLAYKTEVKLFRRSKSYFEVENEYLYEPEESLDIAEGVYFGEFNNEGKADGYGLFVLKNKTSDSYPILVDGVQKDIEWRDCELYLGNWSDGTLTGSYIFQSRSVPVDNQYFDDEHITFKQYVYKTDDKLDKAITYIDTLYTEVGTKKMDDTLQVIEVDYLDWAPYDDGLSLYRGDDEVYHGDRVEWQIYFRHDRSRWDGLYTKGMYTKSEVYKTYSKIAPTHWNNSMYYDGYRAFYNEKEELTKYREYNWMHPTGSTVPQQSNLSLGELILGGAVIFFAGVGLYKLLSTSSKGKTTEASEKYLENKRAEIQAGTQSYNEKLKEAEKLERKAEELEALISSATYLSESEIYDYKQQIKELRREANRIKPSLWD